MNIRRASFSFFKKNKILVYGDFCMLWFEFQGSPGPILVTVVRPRGRERGGGGGKRRHVAAAGTASAGDEAVSRGAERRLILVLLLPLVLPML